MFPRRVRTGRDRRGSASRVSKQRDDARKRLFHQLPVDELRRTARKLDRLVDEIRKAGGRRGTRPARADPRVRWRWAIDAACRGARHAAARPPSTRPARCICPNGLHDVRIAIKKLRYAVELGAERRREARRPTCGR